MKNFPLKISYAVIIIMVVLFWARGTFILDPDFGWHLKTGQLILSSGIPKTDPFSYTMPSFPYVDHAWAGDALIAALYPIIKIPGLALAFSILTVITLLISADNLSTKGDWLANFPLNIILIFSVPLMLSFFLIRTQVATWLLFALLVKTLFKPESWKKYRMFVPFLFLAWANLHGGFSSGLVVMALVIAIRALKERKVNTPDLIIFSLSAAATLFNPYGFGLWREIWLTLTSSLLRGNISEWRPFFPPDLYIIWVLPISLFTLIKFRKHHSLEEIVVYFVLLIQGFISVKNLPLWLTLVIFTGTRGIKYVHLEAKKHKYGEERFKKIYKAAWMVAVAVLILHGGLIVKSGLRLSESNFYPKNAVDFIRKNPTGGQIFSVYDWGGYLIWKLPEKKTYIDGRMAVWHWGAPGGEEGNVLKTFLEIAKGSTSYKTAFDKYNINTVLIPATSPKISMDKFENIFRNFLAGFGIKKNDFDIYETLKNDGWKEVYKDSVAVLYQRN
jgi:hypothetical protein